MMKKQISIFIGSLLVMGGAQAQELTDTSTWKYINDGGSPSTKTYKKSDFEKKSGAPKKNLTNINASLDTNMLDVFYGLLPPGGSIDTSLLNSTFNNISVKDDFTGVVTVKVAFLDENAGYNNALGYFIYNTSTPPTSITNIDNAIEHVVIFPNASKDGDGELEQGDQVDLYIELTAGQSIGFFIASDNWVVKQNGQQKTDLKYDQPFYTLSDLNPSSTAGNQYHVLFDGNDPDDIISANSSGAFIYGFEDRPLSAGGGDKDYNDLSFHVEVTPLSAIANRGSAKKLGKAGDTNNIQLGKLAFEDNWPMQGDYDFNDAVVSYDINKVTSIKADSNGNDVNIIRTLSASYEIEAIGASYRNGLALSLPGISLTNIESLNLTKLNSTNDVVASYEYANGGFSANEITGLGLEPYQYPLALETQTNGNERLVITLTENFFEELSVYDNSVSDPSDSEVCMFQTTDDSDLGCDAGTTANSLALNIVFKQDSGSEANWVNADTTLTNINYDHFIFASEKGNPTDVDYENTVYRFSRDNSDDSWFTQWAKGFDLFGKRNGPGRSLEVHLAGYSGTQFFEQDGSYRDPTEFTEPLEEGSTYEVKADLGIENAFVAKVQGLPWVLDLPKEWEHPLEYKDMSEAYPTFIDWLEVPENNSNWYKTNANDAFIYRPESQ